MSLTRYKSTWTHKVAEVTQPQADESSGKQLRGDQEASCFCPGEPLGEDHMPRLPERPYRMGGPGQVKFTQAAGYLHVPLPCMAPAHNLCLGLFCLPSKGATPRPAAAHGHG